ncbi:unnamed protein product [Acanthosepion pharaonis]|uniref:Uncharacterized protein n=1 Tax=Acanthosepion pharaonis TaxID=158019 RepID=A0A812EBV0_ACAPH|nr:unnamed protein product [Sepia pharaonis]
MINKLNTQTIHDDNEFDHRGIIVVSFRGQARHKLHPVLSSRKKYRDFYTYYKKEKKAFFSLCHVLLLSYFLSPSHNHLSSFLFCSPPFCFLYSVSLSNPLSISLSFSFFLSSLPIPLSLFLCPSVFLSFYSSPFLPSLCLPSISLFLSLCLSLFHYLSIYLSIYLPHFVYFYSSLFSLPPLSFFVHSICLSLSVARSHSLYLYTFLSFSFLPYYPTLPPPLSLFLSIYLSPSVYILFTSLLFYPPLSFCCSLSLSLSLSLFLSLSVSFFPPFDSPIFSHSHPRGRN